MPKRKYGNKKIQVNDQIFDSIAECTRWGKLVLLEKLGHISDLKRQVEFELIPRQRRDDGKAERACKYIADFTYMENGKLVVEDKKGFRTPDYVQKRKLMLMVHGISIRET